MLSLRLIAAGFGLLTLYYLRFFVAVRQEASTLVQIGILLVAAAILVVPVRATWRLSSAQTWTTGLVALGLVMGAFVWADQGSHSASDTLNRAVPAMCLIVALALRLVVSRTYNRSGAAT